jgi:hypothetical protein
MGLSSHYLEDKEFLFSRISGDLNNLNLFHFVLEVNRLNANKTIRKELADCREVTTLDEMTVPGVVACARAEKERSESLLAILITESALQFGMARAFQTFSADQRKGVEIFTDIHEALAWLAKDEQEAEVIRSFVESLT